MAGTAPFQLWIDGPKISTIIVAGGIATVTLTSSHFFSTGSYVQIEGAVGTAGTALNTVSKITVSSGSAFTFATSGSAGTATSGSAVVSVDLLQPIINYSAENRQTVAYSTPMSLQMSASGDGQAGEMSFSVYQDDTPSTGAWWTLIPDQARVRLAKTNTGTAPAATDLYFIGIVQNIEGTMSGSGQGTEAHVSCADANTILDRLIIYGKMPKLT